jgi:hypothetical protein
VGVGWGRVYTRPAPPATSPFAPTRPPARPILTARFPHWFSGGGLGGNISIPPSERLDGLPPAASPLTPNHKL